MLVSIRTKSRAPGEDAPAEGPRRAAGQARRGPLGHDPARRSRRGAGRRGLPAGSASPRCSSGVPPMCPRPGWWRPGRRWRRPARAWRSAAWRSSALLAALGRPVRPGVGPADGRLAGAHPDGPLLRGDLLGDRPRRRRAVGGARQHRPAVRRRARGPGARRAPGRACSGRASVVGLVGADGGGLGGAAVAPGPVGRRAWWWSAARSPGASARSSPRASMRGRADAAGAGRLADGGRRPGPRAGERARWASTPRRRGGARRACWWPSRCVGLGGAAGALLHGPRPGAGRRGLGLVLPDPGDRRAERLAAPGRDAGRRAWWWALRGCRSGCGWCSARAARAAGPVGRLRATTVSTHMTARRP